MANQSTDQQILQLIQIKLGLEQKSQKIFRQLLQNKQKDPLDQLFKSLVSKNRKIESLKLELQRSRAQIDKLQTKHNPHYRSPTNSNQARTKSLPDQHEPKMKSIEEDKRKVESDRNKYRQKVESFITFLIKCIREVSRVQNDRLDSKLETQTNSTRIDSQIERRIKGIVRNHQQLIFQTQMQREAQTQSVTSMNTIMTGVTRATTESGDVEKKQKQNLHRLIKEIKGKLKQPEQMFSKIHKALGLQQEWKDYIGKLKEQINSFRQFKQFARIEEQRVQQQGQQIGFSLRKQMDNQQKWRKSQQAQKSQENNLFCDKQLENVQPAKKFSINLWNIDVCKISQKINYEQQQYRLETMFSQALKKTDKQLNQQITHFHNTINSTVSKMFQLLDALLGKHNQHPFNNKQSLIINGRLSKQINCKQFMRNDQWNDVDRMIFKEIQDRFKFLERRVKFYSANRCVLRNQAPES